MTSIIEARFALECKLVALAAGSATPPLVESIQAVRAEDGGILVYVHLSDDELNGGCPLVASVQWGAIAFDEAEFIEAFWRAGPPSLARH